MFHRRAARSAAVPFCFALALVCAAGARAALHPGDKLDVIVYNHPELSGTRTLDAAGNVSLPVAGTVAALDLEPAQVAERVRARLTPYVRKVAVSVQLAGQGQSVFVTGGPNGVLAYRPGQTLASVANELQALGPAPLPDGSDQHAAAAHDLLVRPLDLENGALDFHRVGLLRDGRALGWYDLLALREAGQPGPMLMPGDTIQLADKPLAVAVSGDVEKPGTAHLALDEPLAQALNQVGGNAASSSQTGITLIRGGVARTVSLGSAEFGQPAVEGDRLVVPRAPRVDVLGNVTHPGETVLRGNATLVSAIYYAGGPAEFANLKAVEVAHDGRRSTYNLAAIQKGATGANPVLADGDVVFVPQGSKFRLSDVWSALGALGLFGVRL